LGFKVFAFGKVECCGLGFYANDNTFYVFSVESVAKIAPVV